MLCDTGPGFRNHEARTAWNERVNSRAHDLEIKGLDALGRGREVLMACHRSAQGLAMRRAGWSCSTTCRCIDSLRTIAAPALIVIGADDSEYFSAATYMASMIPAARRAVIPGARAVPNLDQPQLFNRVLDDFLGGLPTNVPASSPGRGPPRQVSPSAAAGWVSYR